MLLERGHRVEPTNVTVDDTAEALIREARRRTRKRRLRGVRIVALIVGVAVLAYAELVPGGSGLLAGTASSPFVNLRAFRRQGDLAFVSRGRLWVLDGTDGTVRELPTAQHQEALSPTFSHDGRWLAYLTDSTNPSKVPRYELWIARADGTSARAVGDVESLVGWSPHGDTAAVTLGRQTKHLPYGSATTVALVSPTGHERTLLQAPNDPSTTGGMDAITGAVWSPSGNALAVTAAGGLANAVYTVPIASGAKPTVWFAARGSQRVQVTGMRGRVPTEVIPDLAGWWSGWGIAFWIFDFGGVRNPDNTPLVVVARPGAQPRLVAQTLSTGITDAVSAGARDSLALVSSGSFGREYAAGKTVETCPANGGCTAVPGASIWSGPDTQRCETRCAPPAGSRGKPGSGVSEDPSWSPNGLLLAYVKAPAANTGAWPSDAWFADHAVYVWNSQTNATRRVGAVNGAALPTWSRNERDLLYESDDGLWLMPVTSGKPTEIERPLYSESEWNAKVSHVASISFYGQIPWDQQFSWSSP
jgi:WD40-like Beta Propeller Repeat